MSLHLLALPDGEAIPYQLERRPRKTVGMRISSVGLVVRAPSHVPQSRIEQLLRTKADWIRSKLKFHQENAAAPKELRDGASLLLLGSAICLRVAADACSRAAEFEEGVLYVALPTPENEAAVARKVLQWYRKQALLDFSRRLQLFAAKLGVPLPKLLLSNARARWGSCNSKSEIRLNWRLLQAPPHIINYVVCHELAHLKQMNHSPKFWALVASLCPDYKKAEKELKALSEQLHGLDAFV